MKKIIVMMMVVVMTMLSGCNGSKVEHEFYPKGGVIVELDKIHDVVVVEDASGFTWEFFGCEDWTLGEGCTMIMDTKGTTDTILDDEIVCVRYEDFNILVEAYTK